MSTVLSAFQPVRNNGYFCIIEGRDTYSNTPSINQDIIDVYKPTPNTTSSKYQNKKKKWPLEAKQKAVTKALEIGITHAIDYLCVAEPTLFSSLSPSTLQYWVSQRNKNKKEGEPQELE